MDAAFLRQAEQLNDSDKLELIGALWDSVDHRRRAPSEAITSLVDERLAEVDRNPEAELSSAEFWVGIHRRYA